MSKIASPDQILWGIHSEADDLFLQKNYIAIGWPDMGDLAAIKPATRDGFKANLAHLQPDKPAASIRTQAGQPFRFVHEMKVGDYVVYPSKVDNLIHIGKVTGEYQYKPNLNPSYPNLRAVEWLAHLPRPQFDLAALQEIGAYLSLFQVSNFADDFFVALQAAGSGSANQSSPPAVSPPSTIFDAGVAQINSNTEQTTRDFIIERLYKNMNGHPLAHFVAHLLEIIGYHTVVAKPGPDGGIDIRAHKGELGFEPPVINVQVKSTLESTGDPVVSALVGKVKSNEYGLFVTLGTFTKPAQNYAAGISNLRLINGAELVELILQHYEQLNSRYKALIPLRRVYIPETLQEKD